MNGPTRLLSAKAWKQTGACDMPESVCRHAVAYCMLNLRFKAISGLPKCFRAINERLLHYAPTRKMVRMRQESDISGAGAQETSGTRQ
jgi:hypothetical protein